jgi:hypothetical protein
MPFIALKVAVEIVEALAGAVKQIETRDRSLAAVDALVDRLAAILYGLTKR